MRQAFAVGVAIVLSGIMVKAQESAQPSKSNPQTSAQVILARVSTGSLDPVATVGISALKEPAAVTPEPILPITPQPIIKPASNSELGPGQREVRIWRGLVIAQHSAAIFDAWTTHESLASGNGYERNPLVKPFANSAAIYPVLQVAPIGFDFISHRMMRSRNSFVRKTWWLPQAASTIGSLWCGSRNLHVANLR